MTSHPQDHQHVKPAFPSTKTFTPPGTELLRHIYSPAPGQTLLVLGVLQPFELHAPTEQPGPVPDKLWDRVASALGKNGLLDEGWPKTHGELLAAGACHPPKGHRDQPVSVRISAGSLDKQLAVFGERRYGLGGHISPPLPFDRMPLTPEQAFGGDGHTENPLGKGLDTADGAELPNIELPRMLISARGDRPRPAGFGPLPVDHPERARHLGDLGTQWLKERWPHLPLETDPRFFQTAPPDQRLDGFWTGGETVRVTNMHPDFPDLTGQVPRLRPRCFVHQSLPDEELRFVELKVNADTVWLFPGERMGLIIYRTLVPVHTPDGRDVNGFLAEFESLDAPELPVEHYITRCLHAMMPEAVQGLDLEEQKKAYAELSDHELLAKIGEQKQLFKQMLDSTGMDDEQIMRQLSENPHTRKFAQTIAQRNGNLTGFFNEIEHLVRVIEGETSDPAPRSPSLESVLPPPVATAPEAPNAPPQLEEHRAHALRDEGMAARHRQTVVHRVNNGQSCNGLDLSQANLAGLDLAGVDFSGALLAGANFAGAQLQGANLQAANLQSAKLEAANLSGCQLAGALLEQASLTGATLKGAILDGSDCTGANFAGTDLSGISLRQATLSYAWLNQVRAPQIQAGGADFSHANLEGIDLTRATLDHANFTGARLRRAVLDDASCLSANFTQADLSEASAARSDLSSSQSTPGSQWRGANLQRAILNDASWMGASLEGVRLQEARALNTDLSDTDLRNADALGADLRKTTFDRADLAYANLARTNLMEASFMHAKLGRCRFQDSNLYGATFTDADLQNAEFEGANLEGTILKIRADA